MAVQNINCAAHASTANLWSTKMTGLRLVVDSTEGRTSYSSLLNNHIRNDKFLAPKLGYNHFAN